MGSRDGGRQERVSASFRGRRFDEAVELFRYVTVTAVAAIATTVTIAIGIAPPLTAAITTVELFSKPSTHFW